MVAVGDTLTDVPVTGPMAGLMLIAGEPVGVQLRVVDCPGAIMAGIPRKFVTVGGLPAVTVTVAVDEPKGLVAVSV